MSKIVYGFFFLFISVITVQAQDENKVASKYDPYALFKPEYDWELAGEVNNVCFPTGTVSSGDTLYIYYGAADEQIACASVSISALLRELINNKKNDEK